jgi:hypothetical protein
MVGKDITWQRCREEDWRKDFAAAKTETDSTHNLDFLNEMRQSESDATSSVSANL